MNILLAIYHRLRLIRYHLSRNETHIVLWAGLTLIVIGTFVHAWLEGWSLLDYTTIITITTVGHGDLSPQTHYGRLFAIFLGNGRHGLAKILPTFVPMKSCCSWLSLVS